MAEFKQTIQIHRPVDAVFDYFLGVWQDWMQNGRTWGDEFAPQLAPERVRGFAEIVIPVEAGAIRIVPDQLITCEESWPGKRQSVEHKFEPVRETTRVTLRVAADGKGWSRLYAWWYICSSERSIVDEFKDHRDMIEGKRQPRRVAQHNY